MANARFFENNDLSATEINQQQVEAPLLESQASPQLGWLGWIKQKTTEFIADAKDNLLYGLKNPHKVLAATIIAFPPAFFSFFSPSHITPEKVARNWKKWWNTLSLWKKIHSSLNFICTFDINFRLASYFTMLAIFKFKEDIRDFAQNPFGKSLVIASGLFAAVVTGYMGYQSLVWLKDFSLILAEVLAGTAALGNLVMIATGRYIAIKSVGNWLLGFFNADKQAQKQLINKLTHIKKEYQDDLDALLADKALVVNGHEDREAITDVLQDFIRWIDANPSCLRDQTFFEKIGPILDLIPALFAIASFGVFDQKFVDAFASCEDLWFKTNKINQLPSLAKLAIGSYPGAISFFLYFISSLEVRETILENIREHPIDTIRYLLVNAFACSSMQTMAETMVTDPNSIISFMAPKPGSSSNLILSYLNGTAMCVTTYIVNANAALKAAYPPQLEKRTLKELSKWVKSKDLTHSELSKINFFAEAPVALSTEENPPEGTISLTLSPN